MISERFFINQQFSAVLILFLNLFIFQNLSAQDITVDKLTLNNYDSFKVSVKPLIDEMATKRIVALGEGTHGTSEFYKVRYWITKILIEEKGFNQVALENDYSDAYLLSQELNKPVAEYTALLKKYLLSIWQNSEVEELVKYIQQRNLTHSKVELLGIDYNYTKNDVLLIQQFLSEEGIKNLLPLTDSLLSYASYQDSIWNSLNTKGFNYDRQHWFNQGLKGYYAIDTLQQSINALRINEDVKKDLQRTILNCKLGFNIFYQVLKYRKDASRDSSMAVMAAELTKNNSKLIIWAHNAHVAKKSVFENENGGGMGGFIEAAFPNEYYVVGTGTASGSFSATTDRFDTRYNLMKPYKLSNPIKNSWEYKFSRNYNFSFLLNSKNLKAIDEENLLRFIGYSPESGKSTYRKTNLKDLFDAYIFIPETKASNFLQ